MIVTTDGGDGVTQLLPGKGYSVSFTHAGLDIRIESETGELPPGSIQEQVRVAKDRLISALLAQ